MGKCSWTVIIKMKTRNVPDRPPNVSLTECLFDLLKHRLNPKRQQNKQQVKSTVIYITVYITYIKFVKVDINLVHYYLSFKIGGLPYV